MRYVHKIGKKILKGAYRNISYFQNVVQSVNIKVSVFQDVEGIEIFKMGRELLCH